MRRRHWQDDLLLTIPLDPDNQRRVTLYAPHDGLSPEEAERVANVVRAWAGCDASPPPAHSSGGVS